MNSASLPLSRAERLLVIALRALGILDLFALIAVAMPFSWSAAAHEALGMGALPRTPIIEYLIRSTSLLYALHAAMILFLSCDVRRYAPFITFFAWAALIHGTILGLIDWHAKVPLWWNIQETLAYWAIGSAVLILQKQAKAAIAS